MPLDPDRDATFGLESVVARELEALGYESRALRPGWLSFDGDESAVARANLWLRASDRVLLRLASFPAADFDALFDGAREVRGSAFFRETQVPVRVTLRSIRTRERTRLPEHREEGDRRALETVYRLESLAEDGPLFPSKSLS